MSLDHGLTDTAEADERRSLPRPPACSLRTMQWDELVIGTVLGAAAGLALDTVQVDARLRALIRRRRRATEPVSDLDRKWMGWAGIDPEETRAHRARRAVHGLFSYLTAMTLIAASRAAINPLSWLLLAAVVFRDTLPGGLTAAIAATIALVSTVSLEATIRTDPFHRRFMVDVALSLAAALWTAGLAVN